MKTFHVKTWQQDERKAPTEELAGYWSSRLTPARQTTGRRLSCQRRMRPRKGAWAPHVVCGVLQQLFGGSTFWHLPIVASLPDSGDARVGQQIGQHCMD